MGYKVFIFQFDDEYEKDRLLVRQPWSFNKSLLMLKEFDDYSSLENVNLDWRPFWIQIHRLPIALMNEKIEMVVGEGLKELLVLWA